MREVILQFLSEEDLAAALLSAADTGVLRHDDAEDTAGLVHAVIQHGAHRLALFAQVGGGEIRFTDERSDLRFQFEQFAEQVGIMLPEANEDLSDGEVEAVQGESVSANPQVEELKRIKVLPMAQKLRLAEEGNLTQRTLLFRMYGKLVFESLLRNSRITEPEVAKLAKLGTLPPHLFQAICKRPDWLRSERIRNNLLANPRTPAGIMQRIVGKLSKQELRPLLRRRDLPQPVQAAIRAQNAKSMR